MPKHGFNVHHFFVLLMAISYFNLAIAHGYEFFTSVRHNGQTTEQHQADAEADAKTLNSKTFKIKEKMEKKTLKFPLTALIFW